MYIIIGFAVLWAGAASCCPAAAPPPPLSILSPRKPAPHRAARLQRPGLSVGSRAPRGNTGPFSPPRLSQYHACLLLLSWHFRLRQEIKASFSLPLSPCSFQLHFRPLPHSRRTLFSSGEGIPAPRDPEQFYGWECHQQLLPNRHHGAPARRAADPFSTKWPEGHVLSRPPC